MTHRQIVRIGAATRGSGDQILQFFEGQNGQQPVHESRIQAHHARPAVGQHHAYSGNVLLQAVFGLLQKLSLQTGRLVVIIVDGLG